MQKIILIKNSYMNLNVLSKHFEIYLCKNIKEAKNLIKSHNINIVLINYIDFIKDKNYINISRKDHNIYIIAILNNNLSVHEKEQILSSNIDDFIDAPIDYVELDFITRKLLQADYKKDLYIDGLIIDSDEHFIKNDKFCISLPPKEFQLLHLLFAYPERLFLKDELLNVIWWDKPDSDDNTIRTHINRLRKKIKIFSNIEIETVQCIGYKGIIKDK